MLHTVPFMQGLVAVRSVLLCVEQKLMLTCCAAHRRVCVARCKAMWHAAIVGMLHANLLSCKFETCKSTGHEMCKMGITAGDMDPRWLAVHSVL